MPTRLRFSCLEKADVGHDEIDAGRGVVAERHAHIDAQPGAALFGADPVEREIHADLADAAERNEQAARVRPAPCVSRPTARGKTSPARIVSRTPSGAQQHQASGGVDRLERAADGAVRELHFDGAAETGRAHQPGGADRREIPPAIPLGEPPHHRAVERGEKRRRLDREPGGTKIDRLQRRVLRMIAAIHAEADDRDGSVCGRVALDQDPGKLAAVEQQIVRPFEREPGGRETRAAIEHRVVQRQRRHETDFRRRSRGRDVGQQQARIEVPRFRHPGAAAPAAARGLQRSHDPERAALAQRSARERFGIGRAERRESNERECLPIRAGNPFMLRRATAPQLAPRLRAAPDRGRRTTRISRSRRGRGAARAPSARTAPWARPCT